MIYSLRYPKTAGYGKSVYAFLPRRKLIDNIISAHLWCAEFFLLPDLVNLYGGKTNGKRENDRRKSEVG